MSKLKGRRGQDQPREWWIVVHDERSPYRLRTMWVGDTRATDEGENDDFYPEQLPIGFLDSKKLKIDSTDAFKVLIREAKRAKIGFDSVDYKLRSMEFSDEPVWSLTAKDSVGKAVARVILSGYDATIFRTVWYYKQPSGYPRVVDSALDGLKEPVAPAATERPARKREIEIEPDVPELDELDPIEIVPPAVSAIPAPRRRRSKSSLPTSCQSRSGRGSQTDGVWKGSATGRQRRRRPCR